MPLNPFFPTVPTCVNTCSLKTCQGIHDAHNPESYNSLYLCEGLTKTHRKTSCYLETELFLPRLQNHYKYDNINMKDSHHDLAIHHKIINPKRLKNEENSSLYYFSPIPPSTAEYNQDSSRQYFNISNE